MTSLLYHAESENRVWNGINENGERSGVSGRSRVTVAAGTLQSSMSKGERPNARANASRPVASHLGPFRRELLLHLAVREAVYRYSDGAPAVPVAGLPWAPKDSLTPGVELTRTLSVKISNGLAALEELAFIRRVRTGEGRGPTKTVKVTMRGALEAVGIVERRGLSKSAARRVGDDYFMYLVKNDPAAFAEEVVRKAKTLSAMEAAALASFGDIATPGGLSQGNPGYRKALLAVRAYVRANPNDARAAKALEEAEGYIKPYRPTRSSVDGYLMTVSSDVMSLGRDPMPEDIEFEWMGQALTFDLTGGRRPL